MHYALRRLAKRLVGKRRHIPAPIYNALRKTYRKVGAFPFVKVPDAFDTAFYVQTVPQNTLQNLQPYAHFIRYGHQELRNPGPDFDIVWYLHNYGHTFDPNEIDPFSHYLKTGKQAGHTPHPPRQVKFNKDTSHPLGDQPRRACLFAGYDPDERIDDYVIIYLKELARHADVFYLADCEMPESELAKLDGIVKGAWASRHGAYDFGSYRNLARDLVGWDRLSNYDEVIFANDSCYLIKPLDEVFAQMAPKPCAWWGMQATKGLFSTIESQPFPVADEMIDIDLVKSQYLDKFERDPIYDFHIGSYFMVFRQDVIRDSRFQRVINSIQPEARKLNIIKKYEIGITRFLIGIGYEFSTFGKTLTKRHPTYTDVVFDLLMNGFPFFKRYMLSENHYKVTSLAYWKSILRNENSITDIAIIEENYRRVSNADKLYRNFHILEDGLPSTPPMTDAEFQEYDYVSPKYDHYWGFPVCAFDQNLSDNTRAVFEKVKDDPDIVKVVFTRMRYLKLEGRNIIVVPLKSREGQTYLARCRNLFVKHGARRNLYWTVDDDQHNIINLWHGIPLKKIGMMSLDLVHLREKLKIENSKLRAVISASDDDRLAMHAAFDPLPIDDIWVTGLPRHDFITQPEDILPAFLREQLKDVRKITNGRRMVLFCPTFRNDQADGYYNFTPNQVASLTDFLNKNDLVMGIREHLNDKARQYSSQLVGDRFINVQSRRFPDIEMLYREAAMLVTDYSSCFIDYMLTGRPAISFAYDLAAYQQRERGLFYELEDVFPGPVATDFDSLMAAFESAAAKIGSQPSDADVKKRQFLIKYTDSENSARVVKQTKDLCVGSTLNQGWNVSPVTKAKNSVIFLQDKRPDDTYRHRISILASQLRDQGWNSQTVNVDAVSIELLAATRFVVFCDLQMSMETLDLAEGIKATNGKVIYDLDALIHDEEAFMDSRYFKRDPKLANRLRLHSHHRAQLMMLADGFTVTTPTLLSSVQTFDKPAAIVKHCMSPALIQKCGQLPKAQSDDQTHLSYIIDPGCYAGDFVECAAAVIDLMRERPDVVLHVIGALDAVGFDIPHDLDERIHRHGTMPEAAMHALLRTMDINLAPLSDTAFNDALGAVRVLEAALHGVPTIASPSESHRNTIVDRKTGYLARTHQEWQNTLREAVDDVDMRHNIGQAARRRIIPDFTADIAAKQFTDFLTDTW